MSRRIFGFLIFDNSKALRSDPVRFYYLILLHRFCNSFTDHKRKKEGGGSDQKRLKKFLALRNLVLTKGERLFFVRWDRATY